MLHSMSSLEGCFVDRVTEPVQWIEVPSTSAQAPGRESQAQLHDLRFSTLPELAQHIQGSAGNYTCRFMLVTCRQS